MDDSSKEVLVLDDSTYDRSRSKKVELLSRVFDHTTMKYLKGFRMLTLGWSDRNSFFGIDFALLSSAKEKNRYNEINPGIDKRTCGYKRRQEAVTKTKELIEPMVKRALNMGVLVKSSNGKQARIIFVPSDNERGGLALLFPTMQIDKKIYKVFGVVTNIKEMNGEDLIHWLHERCGKSEEAHAVMKEDLAGGTAVRNAVLTSSITALSLF